MVDVIFSWCYWAYGLFIRSEVEVLPFLSVDETSWQALLPREWVEITLEPSLLSDAVIPPEITRQSIAIQVDGDKILLYLEQVGIFKIERGRAIGCCPVAGVSASKLSLALSGIVMAALLFQRQCVIVHGSAVAAGESAAVLVGDSGAGKSSLAIALHQRGLSILTDDLVVIAYQEGIPQVLPAFPQMRVTRETADALGLDWPSLLGLPDNLKRGFRFESQFVSHAVPLGQIYVLKPMAQLGGIQSLPSHRKLMELMPHAQVMALFSEDRQYHFRSCAQLVRLVPIYACRRSDNWSQLPSLLDALQEKMISEEPSSS